MKTEKVTEALIDDIEFEEYALREKIDDEELDELASSIRRIGVICPLVCRYVGDKLHLVAGHRRLEAAKRCNIDRVPVLVRDTSDQDVAEVAFAENMFRKDLSPVEVAAGVKSVLESGRMDNKTVARALNRSTDWVGRMVAMLAWPADVLLAVHEQKISVSAASNLAVIPDDTYRDFLLQHAVEDGATARTTAAWLQAYRAMQPVEQALESEPVAENRARVPMCPQAPCIGCGEVHRTDELSHVPMCVSCIKTIRNASLG